MVFVIFAEGIISLICSPLDFKLISKKLDTIMQQSLLDLPNTVKNKTWGWHCNEVILRGGGRT